TLTPVTLCLHLSLNIVAYPLRCPPCSSLFPYTTLFRSSGLLLVVDEAPTEGGQAVDQLGRLPVLAMALGQGIQPITNRRQALAIGPGHRPADVRREAVAVEVDGIDIGTGFGHALFENLRALVDQRQQAALADFLV